MENKSINLAVVAEVAEALRDIKQDMVFVGGAVISLYTDDPAADEVRPTEDIDLVLHIVNLSHWEQLQGKLAKLGFHPDPFGESICSYKYRGISVDIMPAEDGPFGPSNRWYKIGWENLWSAFAKKQEIKILSVASFLASKFEAFNNRGKDYRTSHDIEDVIYVLDNRLSIVSDIRKDDSKVRMFIQHKLQEIISKGMLKEVLIAHIHPLMREERMPLVEAKLEQILQE